MKKLSVIVFSIFTLTAISCLASEENIKIKCNIRTKITETGYDAPIMKELASDTKELLGTETYVNFSGVSEDKTASFSVDASLSPYNSVTIYITDKKSNRMTSINTGGINFLAPDLRVIFSLGGEPLNELDSEVKTRQLVLNCMRVRN